jgi:hypothetical protein
VRRVVASAGYARFKLVLGLVYAVIGIAIIAKSIAAVGMSTKLVPSIALGAALIALGIVRLRDFRAIRKAIP